MRPVFHGLAVYTGVWLRRKETEQRWFIQGAAEKSSPLKFFAVFSATV